MLKRIQKKLCTEECVSGCIDVENKLFSDISDIFKLTNLKYGLEKNDDGINVQFMNGNARENLHLLFVRDRMFVSHQHYDLTGMLTSNTTSHFRSTSDAVLYLLSVLPTTKKDSG